MGSRGTTTIDFGAFPGKTDATATVTGESGILANSLVEAWIYPVATADHTADEHVVDAPMITAGNISVGVGFTIYGVQRDGFPVPDRIAPLTQPGTTMTNVPVSSSRTGDTAPRPYGLWTVGWAWL